MSEALLEEKIEIPCTDLDHYTISSFNSCVRHLSFSHILDTKGMQLQITNPSLIELVEVGAYVVRLLKKELQQEEDYVIIDSLAEQRVEYCLGEKEELFLDFVRKNSVDDRMFIELGFFIDMKLLKREYAKNKSKKRYSLVNILADVYRFEEKNESYSVGISEPLPYAGGLSECSVVWPIRNNGDLKKSILQIDSTLQLLANYFLS